VSWWDIFSKKIIAYGNNIAEFGIKLFNITPWSWKPAGFVILVLFIIIFTNIFSKKPAIREFVFEEIFVANDLAWSQI